MWWESFWKAGSCQVSDECLCLVTYSWFDRITADKVNGVAEVLTSYAKWWHYIDYTWMVIADLKELHQRLAPFFGAKGEFLLIVQVQPGAPWAGFLPEEAWDWLKNRREEAQDDFRIPQ